MPLGSLNTLPEDNLRLPDALTIRNGPARLLSRFVLQGDKLARGMELELRLRHDFDELLYCNREASARGQWFRLLNTFNPEYTDLTPDNSFWIAGYDAHGELVTSYATYLFDWRGTNLKEQAGRAFYGCEQGRSCIVTADAAENIGGIVSNGGAAWVRPDWRGRQLSHLLPRLCKAFVTASWPIDWHFGFVQRPLVNKQVHTGYGAKHLSWSVFYPQSPWGDLEVAVGYTSVEEIYADLAAFLDDELSRAQTSETGSRDRARVLEHRVTNISSELVLQGSSNRS